MVVRACGALFVAVVSMSGCAAAPRRIQPIPTAMAAKGEEPTELMERRCSADDDSASCIRLGIRYVELHRFEEARRFYERECSRDYADGCTILGTLLSNDELPFLKDEPLAQRYFDRACELHNENGCAFAAWGLYEGRAGIPDKERGLRLLQESCAHKSPFSCGILANITGDWDLMKRACEMGHDVSCMSLAQDRNERRNLKGRALLNEYGY